MWLKDVLQGPKSRSSPPITGLYMSGEFRGVGGWVFLPDCSRKGGVRQVVTEDVWGPVRPWVGGTM